MPDSPKARHSLAAPQQVPQIGWQSAHSGELLAQVCRHYGLPRELNGERGGLAVWEQDDLGKHGELARIVVRDGGGAPLEYKAVCARPLLAPQLVAQLQPLWRHLGVAVYVGEQQGSLLARGPTDAATLTALALAACCAEGMLSPETIERDALFELWQSACAGWGGHERVRELLRYALLPSARPKTYEHFLRFRARSRAEQATFFLDQ